jgi:hypothetical protein
MTRTFNTLVASLWCLHWPGARALSPATTTRLRSSGVVLDTCLRQLAFGLAQRPVLAADAVGELSTGPSAYRLLLEVASGLRSVVPGETNVFGQFRRAAEEAATLLAPDHWQRLRPLVQAVQADTRALRTGYLLGLAGSSYGSLVRALLSPERDARVLFVGTGDLTRSMLPFFRAFEVGVWNHCHGAPLTDVCRWFAPDQADAAAGWATDIVFTTPPDPVHDAAWCSRLRPQPVRGLVHLGRRRSDGPLWPPSGRSVTPGFDLDDVFDLASSRDQSRRSRLTEAALACTALVEARLEDARPLRLPAGLARRRA